MGRFRVGGPPAATPPVAGRYVLLDQVATGGMSTVWRAWDLRERRVVAAKVMDRADGTLLLRFVQEQDTRVHHPHVVTPLGWAAEDGRVVLTMELLRGGTVATLLRDHGRPLPPAVVGVLLGQLLAGLGAVHAAGVVHRDVKPGNLLLEATGPGTPHLRVGDFGVAAHRDRPRLTRAPGLVGTEGYVPPEAVAGAAPDPGQDLYAAGVVAAVLLTALPSTDALTALPPGPLSDLATVLASPDPRWRPASASAAGEVLTGLGLPATTGGLVVRDRLGPDPRPPRSRDWWAMAALGCSGVAVSLAGAAARLAAG